jgi:hypothetical protein
MGSDGAGAGGAGAEAGAGGAGAGGKMSAGIPDHSSEGFLTAHRSHCSKTVISPTTTPFTSKYILNQHPVTAPTKKQ